MRRCTATILVVLCTAMLAGASQSADDPEDEIAHRAEMASESARPQLYIQAAEQQMQKAKEFYDKDDIDAGHSAVKKLVTYSEKATEAAAHTGNRLKPTEISLRKMADKLRGIRRTLAFEDQKPVHDAADRLENLRTELLGRMFRKEKK